MPGPIGANEFYTDLAGFTGDVTRYATAIGAADGWEDFARPWQKPMGRLLAGLSYMMRQDTGDHDAFVAVIDGFSLIPKYENFAEECAVAYWDDAGGAYHATDADYDAVDHLHDAFGALAIRIIAVVGSSTFVSAINQAATTHWP